MNTCFPCGYVCQPITNRFPGIIDKSLRGVHKPMLATRHGTPAALAACAPHCPVNKQPGPPPQQQPQLYPVRTLHRTIRRKKSYLVIIVTCQQVPTHPPKRGRNKLDAIININCHQPSLAIHGKWTTVNHLVKPIIFIQYPLLTISTTVNHHEPP